MCIRDSFLFNTLNMIASTAQIEDADTTEKMIHALSRLFRYNLKSTDSVMPLERELKVVQDYICLLYTSLFSCMKPWVSPRRMAASTTLSYSYDVMRRFSSGNSWFWM